MHVPIIIIVIPVGSVIVMTGSGLGGPYPALVLALTVIEYGVNGCRGPTLADCCVSFTLTPARGRLVNVL